MDRVPLIFAETVARLLDDEWLQNLKETTSRIFKTAGRSLWENRLLIIVNVVYKPTTEIFEYCLSCRRSSGNSRYGPEEPYTYDPADHRFVRLFAVMLYSNRSDLNLEFTWTSATPSDPTLLKLLRTPFAQTLLNLDTNCSEFLELLPDYCAFNYIVASEVYSEVIDAIIERSQECGRLESVDCKEFFTKRGREASIEWILSGATNRRLRRIYYKNVDSRSAIESALDGIGVQ